jgi:tRNA nucleotidyltransferase/poly(A) polymerase
MADNSFEAAKALIKLINAQNYEAYVVGDMCLLSIHNKLHKERLPIKTITIATNMDINILKNMFTKHIEENTYSIIINFANYCYRLVKYHKVINFHQNIYLNVPYIEELNTIDEFIQNQDFSIQTLYVKDDFLTNIYENTDPKIDDIRNKIIRIIGNPEEKIKNNPNIILNAFYYMSKLGYQFDAQTMSAIMNNISLIKYIPLKQFGITFLNIISEKHVYKTLSIMQELNIFNVEIEGNKLLSHLQNKDLDCLKAFEKHANMQIEIIAELFDTDSLEQLLKFNILDKDTLRDVKWLITNKNIYKNRTDREWREVIYNSIDDSMDIHYIKKLILKNNARQKLTHKSKVTDEQCKNLFFNLCARPYFIEQLDIKDEDILKLDNNANIQNVKKALLEKLIFTDKYPSEEKIKEMLCNYMRSESYEKIKKSE